MQPWLKGLGFAEYVRWGDVDEDRFSRTVGDFEQTIVWRGLPRRNRGQLLCGLHGQVVHVPSQALAARLSDRVNPEPGKAGAVVSVQAIRPVYVGVGELWRFGPVRAEDSPEAVAAAVIADIESILPALDAAIADPHCPKGVLISALHSFETDGGFSIDRQVLAEFFKAMEQGEPFLAWLNHSSPDARRSALAQLEGEVIGNRSRYGSEPLKSFPDAALLQRRVVELAVDDRSGAVRSQAQLTAAVLKVHPRLPFDVPLWSTTLHDVETLDGRKTNSGVAVAYSLSPERAAEKFGVDLAKVSHVPPGNVSHLWPYFGEVLWHHPADTDLVMWHRGTCEVWTPPLTWLKTPTVTERLQQRTLNNPAITHFESVSDSRHRHAIASRHSEVTLCGLPTKDLTKTSAFFVLDRSDSCPICQTKAGTDRNKAAQPNASDQN